MNYCTTALLLLLAVRGVTSLGELQLNLTVEENTAPQTLPLAIGILTTLVKLSDLYPRGVVSRFEYIVLKSSDSDSLASKFSVNANSGQLTLVRPLNRELLCPSAPTCSPSFRVSIRSARDDVFRILSVTVNVLDINDNRPTFAHREQVITVNEDASTGYRFSLMVALDEDSPLNAVRRYVIDTPTDKPTFGVDISTDEYGVVDNAFLVLLKPLDRELRSRYEFKVTAVDGGGRKGHLKVVVKVTDVDDNEPKFTLNNTLNVVIDETKERGRLIAEVKAVDLDEGHNGIVVYAFTSATSKQVGYDIELNRTSGRISVGASGLDYERRTGYRLEVTVASIDIPAHVTDVLVIEVTVKDVNDERPRMYVTMASDIYENLDAGALACLVEVLDTDTGSGGRFRCSLSEKEGPLQLKNMHDNMLVWGVCANLYSIYTSYSKIGYISHTYYWKYIYCIYKL